MERDRQHGQDGGERRMSPRAAALLIVCLSLLGWAAVGGVMSMLVR